MLFFLTNYLSFSTLSVLLYLFLRSLVYFPSPSYDFKCFFIFASSITFSVHSPIPALPFLVASLLTILFINISVYPFVHVFRLPLFSLCISPLIFYSIFTHIIAIKLPPAHTLPLFHPSLSSGRLILSPLFLIHASSCL